MGVAGGRAVRRGWWKEVYWCGEVKDWASGGLVGRWTEGGGGGTVDEVGLD